MTTLSGPAQAAALFDPLRPALIRVAYRMLGSVADAEDVVQDACLRWMETDLAGVRDPEAYLRRIVTRLCLDQLKSARHRRETYIGPWLPDPVIESGDEAPDEVTLPLLLALERLSPLERAAFLLHDVFGMPFDEVADAIGRDAAACRQLAHRARHHVRTAKPRFTVDRGRGLDIAEAFYAASRGGDLQGLRAMLAEDVEMHADGGGKRNALRQIVAGLDRVMHLHANLARLWARAMSRPLRYGYINGLPGFVTLEQDDTLQTTALQIEGERITAIYVVRNPDKVKHLAQTLPH